MIQMIENTVEKKRNVDVAVLRNEDGRLQLRSNFMFRHANTDGCREFIQRMFTVTEVQSITINPTDRTAIIQYANHNGRKINTLQSMARVLRNGKNGSKGNTGKEDFQIAGLDGQKVSIYRQGERLTTWEVKHEIPGRIRFRNSMLFKKKGLCQNIERELLNSAGIERYKVSPLTCSVLVVYNEAKLDRNHIIKILDDAISQKVQRGRSTKPKDLPMNTLTLGLASATSLFIPALIPVSAGLVLYNAIPSYKGAIKAFRKRKVSVDILDAIIVTMCLAGGSVFAAAIMNWCLSLGRCILGRTSEDSKKMLMDVFGKQPRFVWLHKDGQDIEIPLTKLKLGDIIAINTGEMVPCDGIVSDGTAMVDQHILTGESAPVEKAKGDQVFTSTMLLAGKVYVKVSQTGDDTTSAKIKHILTKTAGYKIASQSRGEKLADKAVLPTLAVSYLGYTVSGFDASLAIINCDFGTGIRIAAPLGLLSTLAVCARDGVLVKDGRVLETLPEVDTFLFDKTGTLTKGVPEVDDIVTTDGISKERLLMYAAVAEEKFTHPIAMAILEKSKELNIDLPKRDEAKCHVGYGITVGINGKVVKVGSARFMKMEGIDIPHSIVETMEMTQKDGGSMVMVAINNHLAGGLKLNTSHRPEAISVIQGLRKRGVKEVVLISGDHEHPTQKLAELLGADRYFAEVLPHDKANYVKKLQREGRKVAFVGDGINDTIALKKADVSISLKGAASIATDTAQIVFMDDNLHKLLKLIDNAKYLRKNVNQSWAMIAVSNTICITGAIFGLWGLAMSLIMNNGVNFFGTLNGVRPLWKVYEQDLQKEMENSQQLQCLLKEKRS